MAQFAEETRAGIRTLERAFAAACGMTPTHYLLARRLDAAYRKLEAARFGDETVTNVAHNSGLSHLGRFSVQFREWFGESPNETLRAEPIRE